MIGVKQFIGQQFLNKKIHIKCDCIVPFDGTGLVVDYSIASNEVVLHIDINGKIIKIGENHPNLKFEFV
jgi:hypothetical protein